MNIVTILLWIKNNWKNVVKGILVASVAFLLCYGIFAHKKNINLSQELEMARNNIEAYQELLDSSQQANNVLRLNFQELRQQHDIVLNRLDSIRKILDIKKKSISIAATQSQVLYVKDSKGVGGDIITILKDTTYQDSIVFNPYTTAYYTIGKDTVNVALDITNDQYLYIYNIKEYKNKKNFIQRLFTLDFKKVNKQKYAIYNTNNLIKSNNIRIVETNSK